MSACTRLSLIGLLTVAASAWSAPSETVATAKLGRLFFAPAERDELDRLRLGIADTSDTGQSSKTVTLNGWAGRDRGGAPTLWVNGQRWSGKPVAGVTLDPRQLGRDGLVVVLPPPDQRSLQLKVGQTLDPAGGRLREVYQRPPNELNPLLQMLAKRGPKPEPATPAPRPTTTPPAPKS